jgi:hypothetical protein
MFDLAKDRLDNSLPSRVHRPSHQGPELPGHAVTPGQPPWRAPAGRRIFRENALDLLAPATPPAPTTRRREGHRTP